MKTSREVGALGLVGRSRGAARLEALARQIREDAPAREHGSRGALTPARVRETPETARRHGFAPGRPATASSY